MSWDLNKGPIPYIHIIIYYYYYYIIIVNNLVLKFRPRGRYLDLFIFMGSFFVHLLSDFSIKI